MTIFLISTEVTLWALSSDKMLPKLIEDKFIGNCGIFAEAENFMHSTRSTSKCITKEDSLP